MQTRITGMAVDFIPTPRPARMLVAAPVSEAAAIFFDAAVVAGGVVFCGGSYEAGADYSGDDREEEGEVTEHPVGEEVGAYYHEEAGGAEAYSEGFGGVSSFFDSDEEGAEYGGYYAYGGEEER